MKATDFSGQISVTSPTMFVYSLAGGNISSDSSVNSFEIPKGFSLDINSTSTDAAGVVNLFLTNDDPSLVTYTPSPAFTFNISAGKFGGSGKQTFDSGFRVMTKYLGVSFTKTAGSNGVLNIYGISTY